MFLCSWGSVQSGDGEGFQSEVCEEGGERLLGGVDGEGGEEGGEVGGVEGGDGEGGKGVSENIGDVLEGLERLAEVV